eukprot:Opistho-2@86827
MARSCRSVSAVLWAAVFLVVLGLTLADLCPGPINWLGDGTCQPSLNIPECDFDHGDCCSWSNKGPNAQTCGDGNICRCRADPTGCGTGCLNGGACVDNKCMCFKGWNGDQCQVSDSDVFITGLSALNSSPIRPGSRAIVSVDVTSGTDMFIVCKRCSVSDASTGSICTGPDMQRWDLATGNIGVEQISLFYDTFHETTTVQCRTENTQNVMSMNTLITVTDDPTLGLNPLPVRREVRQLTRGEWNQFAAAVNEMRRRGIYDYFTQVHVMASNHRLPNPGEDGCMAPASAVKCTNADRTAAHRGPTFFPWHREMLIQFEGALRMLSANASMAMPYWNWGITSPSLFSANYLGGSAADGLVNSGPFASWGIRRCVGCGGITPVSSAEIQSLLQLRSPYDAPPYQSFTGTFRDRLEGWQPFGFHNRMHSFCGGDMLTFSSPKDIAFYLIHSFTDRLFHTWMGLSGNSYRPVEGDSQAPSASVPSSAMFPWDTLISQVFSPIGYTYDTAPIVADSTTASRPSSVTTPKSNATATVVRSFRTNRIHPLWRVGNLRFRGVVVVDGSQKHSSTQQA